MSRAVEVMTGKHAGTMGRAFCEGGLILKVDTGTEHGIIQVSTEDIEIREDDESICNTDDNADGNDLEFTMNTRMRSNNHNHNHGTSSSKSECEQGDSDKTSLLDQYYFIIENASLTYWRHQGSKFTLRC